MKKTLSITLALLVAISFASCRKTDATRGITFGQGSRMTINATNDTINYQNHEKNIDLDGDGLSDLLLSLNQPGSAGTGHWNKFTAKCMPVTQLLGQYVEKEKYIHSEISYSNSEDGSVVIVRHENYYTCNPMAESDSVYEKKEGFALLANEAGDVFKLDDEYLDTEATIYEQSFDAPEGYEEISADTTAYWMGHHLNDCYNFPLDTPVYIGLKLSHGGTTRLGWVKVTVSQGRLVVTETAIQK